MTQGAAILPSTCNFFPDSGRPRKLSIRLGQSIVLFQAIDVWMGTCTAFVFAALVEFTFVNYTWRTRGKILGIPTGLETQESGRTFTHEQKSFSWRIKKCVIVKLYLCPIKQGTLKDRITLAILNSTCECVHMCVRVIFQFSFSTQATHWRNHISLENIILVIYCLTNI